MKNRKENPKEKCSEPDDYFSLPFLFNGHFLSPPLVKDRERIDRWKEKGNINSRTTSLTSADSISTSKRKEEINQLLRKSISWS